MSNIRSLIENDKELLDLYYTDNIFCTSIKVGIENNMTTEDILVFALKNGYRVKKNISDEHLEYMKTDCRPIMIKMEDCNKCKDKMK